MLALVSGMTRFEGGSDAEWSFPAVTRSDSEDSERLGRFLIMVLVSQLSGNDAYLRSESLVSFEFYH